MIPTWMIEEVERMRRERQVERRPVLEVEEPARRVPEPEPEDRRPQTVIVIEL